MFSRQDNHMIISFCSQSNLAITSLELNRTALNRPMVEDRCLWKRESCPVLQGWVEFGVGAMWLEQSHPPCFFPYGQGSLQSLSKSFYCAICWIVICNAAMTKYK